METNEPRIQVAELFKTYIVNAVNKSLAEDGRKGVGLKDIREIKFFVRTVGIRLNDGTQISLSYNQI